jgi:hypothetical protein
VWVQFLVDALKQVLLLLDQRLDPVEFTLELVLAI